jgi:hypothetical protein
VQDAATSVPLDFAGHGTTWQAKYALHLPTDAVSAMQVTVCPAAGASPALQLKVQVAPMTEFVHECAPLAMIPGAWQYPAMAEHWLS